MLEIILLIFASVGVYRMAENDEQSGPLWGLLTFGVGFAGFFFVPLPFLRVILAPVIVFILMILYRVYTLPD